MNKDHITTEKAPAAIGPYTQAVKAGNHIFISGQIPLDPDNGELVEGDIKDQTRRVLENIKGIITSVGGTMESIVKTTVYLKNMDNFVQMNSVYAEFFQEKPPARACVEVSRLPKDVDVEIEAVAYVEEEYSY